MATTARQSAYIVEVVDAVKAKGFSVQANRVFAELMAMLRWAEQRSYIESFPNFHKFKSRERPRQRILTDEELSEVWLKSNEIGDVSKDFLQLVILSGQRCDEIRLMTWEEVNLGAAKWTISPDRYKTRIAHVVPLSNPMLKILRVRWTKGATGFVLPSVKLFQRRSVPRAASNDFQAIFRINHLAMGDVNALLLSGCI